MATSNAYSTGKIFDGYMGRNVIINGACTVAQRAANLVASNGISGYGGPDRFYASNSSGGGQFTQSQGTITYGGVSKAAVVQTVNTGTSGFTTNTFWTGITQNIEGLNAYALLGQPITVSFIFNTNVSGTYSLSVRDGSAANSYVTTFTATANTPTKYVFNIPTVGTGFGIPNTTAVGMSIWIGALNNGTFQTGVLGSWISGNFVAAATTNWAATASNFIAVTELQIEEGAIATPFERESYSVTLSKCRRYYYQNTVAAGASQNLMLSGFINGATTCVFSFVFPVQMRVAPTLLSTNLVTTSATSQNTGTSTTILGATTVDSIGFQIGATGATYTVGQGCGLYLGTAGNSGGSFILNAEL